MKRGKLVALEGLDGSGKSTQLARLGDTLQTKGAGVCLTREPTDGPHGRRIRTLARSPTGVPPEQELQLFLEDREQHVRECIAPALAEGRLVLTDRYFLSTVAYQGARGLDWRALLADSEARFPIPDLVVCLELPPEVGLARVRARGGVAEPAFEREGFLTRVAEIFSAIDRPYLHRIDANRPESVVQADLWARVEALRATAT